MLAGLIAPARCLYCGLQASAKWPVCPACFDALPWNTPCCPRCAQPQIHDSPCAECAQDPPAQDSAWCALRLEAPVQRAVHALKYHAGFLQAHVLAALMAQALSRRSAPLPQLLIPVPLHHRRLQRRGYNQSLELARQLTRRLAIPLSSQAAIRTRDTEDQIGKTAAQRRKNVLGAFRITQTLTGQHIALLDDVMTTGATLGELARICRDAGAVRIEVWAAARVR